MEPVEAKQVKSPHRPSILEEYIKREVKFHHLYTNYQVTPSLTKNSMLSQKPNTTSVQANEPEDEEYKELVSRLTKPPKEKYLFPQTSSQEYGWDLEYLVPPVRDQRFYHPKNSSDITRFYGFLTNESKKRDSKKEAAH